jgi:hypothetical protein
MVCPQDAARPASVPDFKATDESKFIPTLAPVLDAVEIDLKVIGHLLQPQTLH